jgi:hypothetical protein
MFVAAAALAISAGLAFAQAPAQPPPPAGETPVTTPEMVNSGKMDDTGMKTIGFDISAGAKPPAAAEARIKSNCAIVVANKANANAKVLKYCQDLTGTM